MYALPWSYVAINGLHSGCNKPERCQIEELLSGILEGWMLESKEPTSERNQRQPQLTMAAK